MPADAKLRATITATDKTGAATSSAQRRMTRLASAVSAIRFAGAAAGVASFVAAMRGATSALEAFDAIGKQASTAGISTDLFQGLKQGASDASVDLGVLDSALIAFVKRVGEARGGAGPLVSGLKNLDAELLRNIQSSRNQEQALKLVADAIQNETDAARRASIANAAFSRSGVVLERVFRNGADGIDETVRKAKALGVVIDRELIAGAEDIATKYGTASRVLTIQFQKTLITLTPFMLRAAQTAERLARAIGGSLDGPVEAMGKRVAALKTEIVGLEKEVADNSRTGVWARFWNETDQDPVNRLREARAELRKLQAAIHNSTFGGNNLDPNAGKPLVIKPTRTSSGGGGADLGSGMDSPLQRSNELLEAQNRLIAENTQEQNLFNDAQQFGADMLADGLLSIVSNGERAEDVLKRMTLQLLQMALQATLLGKGPLGSILGGGGGLVGNLFAGGGGAGGLGGLMGFAGGGSFRVGGNGGTDSQLVAFKASPDETVSITRPGQKSGGGVSLVVNMPIDARGAQAGVAEQIAQVTAEMPKMIRSVVAAEFRANPGYLR